MMQSYKKKDQLKENGRRFFVIFLVFWLRYAAHKKATSPSPLSEVLRRLQILL